MRIANKNRFKRIKVENPMLVNDIKYVLRNMGLSTDFKLELRGYSENYWGLYYPEEKRIVLYVLDEIGEYLPYYAILCTALHEALHHYQHSKPNYVRVHGIMHDAEFKELEQRYLPLLDEYKE